ncbi:hypothetical protein P691DRAFT_803252 [Macrolepiota fuliginosa MF-IS2]|uniref:Gfd2/YDR514C-like C-terminal domain-containing protein n=1 Tax=Macrolepiota fuliginosa MF-IS2 TaxID=1400762 RepID=A0A9P5XA81_9AGAR|nr:hypothetical protein P691DRAFT_803252 [Macrolepiota fuliginosa MF-IS2]
MPADSETVTGYYRYTDIWFEWYKVIPDADDGAALKGILAHDSLVHPDHPLHVEGITGIQLYHGTFESGETRLLFSSAQVDYARYWLHAMKLTKTLLPMPYSDCLVLSSELKHITTHIYPDGGALRGAVKNLDKHNKRLKGSNPALLSRRHIFQRTRELVVAKSGTWCAIDFEGWERDHTIITEMGFSILRWDADGQPTRESGHWIIKEAEGYRNGTYVPDYRYAYNFGTSEKIPRSTFKSRVRELIEQLRAEGPLYLVFHDNSQDIKYMTSSTIDAPLDDLSYLLPDNAPTTGLFVVDTSDLFGALIGLSTGQRRSLEKTCRMLQIDTSFLHNAGNDAYYTLEAMIQMAQGEAVDEQREKRWPNHTPAGTIEVEFKPWEEDSDYSESENTGPNSRNTYAQRN